jgi:putative nucleotidyltransferase with HDIG domain
MQSRIRWYVAAVAVTAAASLVAVYANYPLSTSSVIGDALILCMLAIAGELLGFVLPRSATGSIGFIPYFAAAIIVPSWPSVAAVAAVRGALELASRREAIKKILNVSAHTLMEAIAVSVFVWLGGKSLLSAPDKMNLTQLTKDLGLPAIGAFAAAFFANNLIVYTAIAISSGRRLRSIFLENTRATIAIDLITMPLVFVFAWVYAAFGALAAAALWVPVLGLRQVHRINLELERTNEELLELMVKSLEARDPYTSGHSRRVQHYSTIIARAIGLSDGDVQEVGRAALLHDVGKIHEKYASVLAKTDKLTPEEWAIIQEHPADGANLVSTMTRLRDIVPAIRHHHENWDGTGYPNGVAGELIPLASRIIRFADTIDAMTSERPYRRPMTEVDVRAELVRCRGTQFDPEITDKLLSSPLYTSLFRSPDVPEDAVRAPVVSITRQRRESRVG